MRAELPRVLTAAGAARAGLTPATVRTELRRARWQRLGPGLLLTCTGPPSRADWATAGIELAGPDAALSGWDAVRLRGIGPRGPAHPFVLVLTAPGRRHRVVGGVRIRPSARPVRSRPLSHLDQHLPGMPVVSVARAVADTALDLPNRREVRALVLDAVQRGLCTGAELETEYRCGPRNDSAGLRLALLDVLAGAASLPEAELADMMSRGGLPPYELNVPILDQSGAHLATADVLWRRLRAVLEVDSRRHHFREPDWRRTMLRHNQLTGCGLAVTHYAPTQLRADGRRIVAEIGTWLRARAAELGIGIDVLGRADRPLATAPASAPFVIGE